MLPITSKLFQKADELLFQHLLADEALGAFSAKTRATIIDVFPLLNLGDQRTTAMAAFDQAGERETMWLGANIRCAAVIQNLLHGVPGVGSDERRMHTFKDFATPVE